MSGRKGPSPWSQRTRQPLPMPPSQVADYGQPYSSVPVRVSREVHTRGPSEHSAPAGAAAGREGTSHGPGEAGAIRLPRPGPGCAPSAGWSCPSGALLPQGGQGALGSHGPGAREPSLSEPRRPARASVEAAQIQTCDDSQPPTRPPGHREAQHVKRLSLGRGELRPTHRRQGKTQARLS